MGIAIRAEKLSKAYQLGEFSTGTLSRDIERWWAQVRGKEDPFLKIGETNDRSKKGSSDVVWSLKDISFDIEQGDAVGIIGRNGAGKSTLLKLLSRVTSPTSGSVKIKGRVASLLEVGTGFHPELTGRENIFLNGAILGMRKAEIKRQFDAIVDFAGVERYIETPVKRYSSGMYVRLAFAVAAHLESEILIVDEVLAVGDAEFQKKCLGKMGDVNSKEGRAVLFVSHNMDSITRLCDKAMFLKLGELSNYGPTSQIISQYMQSDLGTSALRIWSSVAEAPGNDFVRLKEIRVIDHDECVSEFLDIRKPAFIEAIYEIYKGGQAYTHGLNLFNESGIHVLSSHDRDFKYVDAPSKAGTYSTRVKIPANFLAEGSYKVSFAVMSYNPYTVHFHEMDVVGFTIKDSFQGDSARGRYGGIFPGVVRPILEWSHN